MSPPKLHILISGASVAGPALAYWLIRAGCKVTVVERAAILRTAGQGIDVRDSARDVIKRMGLFERIRDRSSHEEGFEIVDRQSRPLARFGVDGQGESITCDIEILRGELAGILYDATKDDVTYVFGDVVESLDERADGVRVTFANGTPAMTFDLVVAADGIGSKIRRMMMGSGDGKGDGGVDTSGDDSSIRSLQSYAAYFSIPRGATDGMWAQSRSSHGGRFMMLRPDNQGRTRAFLGITAYEKSDERLSRLARAAKEGIPTQKSVVQDLFYDADWVEMPRILEGMHASDDLYMQHLAQVRLSCWSSSGGRITVIGDAGYSPSPFAGMGTSLAFIGAYILAGEISQRPNDIPAALEAYERVLRPYVENIQNLPPGIPWIICPQTALGVKVVETIARVVSVLSATGIIGFLGKLGAYLPIGSGRNKFKLPEYDVFNK